MTVFVGDQRFTRTVDALENVSADPVMKRTRIMEVLVEILGVAPASSVSDDE
jgi:hypothetical protein